MSCMCVQGDRQKWQKNINQIKSTIPAVIDESTVTDVTETVDDENGVGDAFADEFDAAAVDCDGGAGVVAVV